ncbi:MAG: ankyrin repeat domain-containing protein [Candidatus Dependentiae bacterium]
MFYLYYFLSACLCTLATQCMDDMNDKAVDSILSSDACFSAYMPFDSLGQDSDSSDNVRKNELAEKGSLHPLCIELKNKKLINYREFPKYIMGRLYREFILDRTIDVLDTTVTDERGFTFLHYAAMTNDVSVTNDLLIRHNADIDACSHTGNTPLHTAVAVGATSVISSLLYYGAVPNAQNNAGDTPLHIAVLHDRDDTVLNLLKRKVQADAKNNLGETPLFYAARRGHVKIARYLVCYGADAEKKNKFGKTIFDGIHHQKKREKFKNDMLIRTPLHLAVLREDLQEVQRLLEKHAHVDARDIYRETPLFYAVRQRNAKIVAHLIYGQADTVAMNKMHQKPFEIIIDLVERAQFKENILVECNKIYSQQ